MFRGNILVARAGLISLFLLAACSHKDEAKKPVDTTLPDVSSASAATPTDMPSGGTPIPVSAPGTDDQSATTANMTDYNFNDLPSDGYSGPWVAPNFSGAQRQFREYRTMISDGVKQGPVFAGSVAISMFGCGTDCSMGYAIDLKNGNIVPLPVGGEANSDMELEYHAGSRLLKAAWKGAAKDYSGPPADCKGFAYFEWTGQELKTLKTSPHSPACE